jgi:hypothetical protein
MERILASLKQSNFMHFLTMWLTGAFGLLIFTYYNRVGTARMFLSSGYAVIFTLLLISATLLFVYERRVPFGAYTVCLAAHGVVLTVATGEILLLMSSIAIGLFVDLMYARMQVRHAAWTLKTKFFAAGAGFVICGAHLLSLAYIFHFEFLTVPIVSALILAAGFGGLLGHITVRSSVR